MPNSIWSGPTLLLGLLASSVSCAQPEESSDTVNVGVLLPFSGPASATSSNFERAVVYASDRVNAAGGLHGVPIRIVSADTHSDPARSTESAQGLIDAGVVAVFGVESSEIAKRVAPMFSAAGIPFLSPLVGIDDDALVDCEGAWFRLAPAAHTLGEALAKEMFAKGVASVVILSEDDEYNRAFSDAVKSRFESLGGTVELRLPIDPAAQSYSAVLEQVTQSGESNVVLAASPRTAALVVNDFHFGALAEELSWYFSPLLKTSLFLQNVDPAAVGHALGVAPTIYEEKEEFSAAFRQRWQGDEPLEGAYFYYDAFAITAYALQLAWAQTPGAAEEASFRQAVIDVTATRGRPRRWNAIEDGLRDLEQGATVYYTGLTGPALLDECGARFIGRFSTWTIRDGDIEVDP